MDQQKITEQLQSLSSNYLQQPQSFDEKTMAVCTVLAVNLKFTTDVDIIPKTTWVYEKKVLHGSTHSVQFHNSWIAPKEKAN